MIKQRKLPNDRIYTPEPVALLMINMCNIKETNNASAMQYKEKFREIVDIDFRTITDMDFKYFCYDVIELVEKLGWARFDVIMFGTALKDLAGVLADYDLIELEAAAAKTKRSYNFYIDKLIK